jgi:hypothetical protein
MAELQMEAVNSLTTNELIGELVARVYGGNALDNPLMCNELFDLADFLKWMINFDGDGVQRDAEDNAKSMQLLKEYMK